MSRAWSEWLGWGNICGRCWRSMWQKKHQGPSGPTDGWDKYADSRDKSIQAQSIKDQCQEIQEDQSDVKLVLRILYNRILSVTNN